MSNYQVTARKWRPQDFSQLVGQEHVTTALTNAVNSGKIPHAYLFSGPRGVGKTSSARILSKLLNCVHSPNICGECPACLEIASGQSLDVREIDGASNRGIDQIREIRDNVIYAPMNLKYKIYIIDEVHMLTKEASNALLKVLEEPPSHMIFMLATTEANKVLPTIRSRCQHYLLKRIPLDILIDRLSFILQNENINFEREAVEEIAVAGDGSMRDSQTILDQVILYSKDNLTMQSVREVLGIPETSYFETIVSAVASQDIVAILEQVQKYLMEAGDGVSFAENLAKFLRKGLLIKKLPQNHPLLELSEDKYNALSVLFADLEEDDILTLLNLSLELSETLRHEKSERFWIESTMFKMLDYKNRVSLSELRQEIFKLLGRNTQNNNPGIQHNAPNAARPPQPANTQQQQQAQQQAQQQTPRASSFGDKWDAHKKTMGQRPAERPVERQPAQSAQPDIAKPIERQQERPAERSQEKPAAPAEKPERLTDAITNLFEA